MFHHEIEIESPYFNSLCQFIVMYTYLLSATQLRQGNVFTRVCHSVHGGGADTNEVFEGYVLTRVCLSTGVSAPLHAGIHPPPWQTPLVSPYPPGQTPPLHSACWDMVNKRAVRIPLECNLVFVYFSIFRNPLEFIYKYL